VIPAISVHKLEAGGECDEVPRGSDRPGREEERLVHKQVVRRVQEAGLDEPLPHRLDVGRRRVPRGPDGKDEVQKQGIKHGTLIVDGTFLEKTGEEMEGVRWFWDHSQNKSILAHNVVSTHYIAGKFHVPLDFGIYVKRKNCEDKRQFRTKVEIAKKLAEKAVGYGLPIVVVFDSWYMSEELTSFLKERGSRPASLRRRETGSWGISRPIYERLAQGAGSPGRRY
jgi:hypothetical protein